MASVQFIQLSKSFDGETRAVRDINLAIEDGELVVLVGPSGCGKSTLLRLTAGLEEATAGEIRIGGRVVNDLPPQARDVAMVFQNYALYPHMTVRGNLAFPLRMRGLARAGIRQQVERVAGLLELEPLLDRRPRELSGGQRQRVAMGRALVREPAVFLMDEPLSNLDAKLRVQMRSEITALQRRLRTTTLYVTHDQVEAMTMGDRLAVLHRGQLHQVGPPQQIYNEPADVFVATFIGSPGMNLFISRLERRSSAVGFHWGKQWLPIAPERLAQYPGVANHEGQPLLFGLRPEAFLPAAAVSPEQRIDIKPQSIELMGHETIIYFRPGLEDFSGGPEAQPVRGSLADEVFAREPLFAARLGSSERFPPGQPLPIGIDPRRVFLFDLAGQAIQP